MKNITMKLATSFLLVFALVQTSFAGDDAPMVEIYDISQTVLKMSLKKGITPPEAVHTMLSKAAEMNMKMVGHLPVSDELKARGKNHRHLEVYQFCNPEDAIKMVEFNPIYSAYMPCRIAMVTDEKGITWLLTLNLDMLISSVQLPDHLRKIALTINTQMIEIMTAAATGDF